MGKKDTCVKISVLHKDDYFRWKVKMHLYLMSLDESYVSCVEKALHVLVKTVAGTETDGSVRKDKLVLGHFVNTY